MCVSCKPSGGAWKYATVRSAEGSFKLLINYVELLVTAPRGGMYLMGGLNNVC